MNTKNEVLKMNNKNDFIAIFAVDDGQTLNLKLGLHTGGSCSIDWGDGTQEELYYQPYGNEHYYTHGGDYTVKIGNTITSFDADVEPIDVEQWGTAYWLEKPFLLNVSAKDEPNVFKKA